VNWASGRVNSDHHWSPIGEWVLSNGHAGKWYSDGAWSAGSLKKASTGVCSMVSEEDQDVG
jgi:hypothetical protein